MTCTYTSTGDVSSGQSLPPIALTVDVANNAPSTVTNTATVSFDNVPGDNPSNNTANDPTTILAAAAPIPTLSTWAFILLALLLATLALRTLRARRAF